MTPYSAEHEGGMDSPGIMIPMMGMQRGAIVGNISLTKMLH